MKHIVVLFSVITAFLSIDVQAATHADSILSFTGATRAKFVWMRHTWCDTNYNPTSDYLGDSWSIVGYDTKDNTVRTFSGTSTSMSFGWMGGRVDRSGSWVVWPDIPNDQCMVRDFAAASPARVLIAKGNKMAGSVCFGYEAASGKEYLYIEDSYDPKMDGAVSCYCSTTNKVWKVPFNPATGTVDLAAKIDVGFKAGNGYDKLGISSVSGDGRYIACSFPWPTDYLFDTQNKTIINRHHDGSMFGCQPHVAPDNSYRFFHCMDDHDGVWMFSGNLTTNDNWGLFMYNYPLPGRAATDKSLTDFSEPQWSNHPLFLSNSYPGAEGYGEDGSWGNIGTTASWVKTSMQMKYKMSVFIQKLAPDFKSIVGSMYICPDLRTRDNQLDSWLDIGQGPPTGIRSASPMHRSIEGPQFYREGTLVSVATPDKADLVVRVSDVQGRAVREVMGRGYASVDTRSFAAGVYTFSATSADKSSSQRLTIAQ